LKCFLRPAKREGLSSAQRDEVAAARGKIDAVVAWKFDRSTRSLEQLLQCLGAVQKIRGLVLRPCTEALDTSLPNGAMLFQIIEAICSVGALAHCRTCKGRNRTCPKPGKEIGMSASPSLDGRSFLLFEGNEHVQKLIQKTRNKIRDFHSYSAPALSARREEEQR
jgi:hypothetical protein